MSKPGRKLDLVLANRILLNAGRIPAQELAWLIGIKYPALMSKAVRMGVSVRVRKDNL